MGSPMIAAATSSLEWVLRPPPPETAVRALMARTGWPWAVCALLVQRDLTDLEALRRFLRPRVDHFEPPERLAGMPEAVLRVEAALARGETILVHGDYDADGVCAAALLVRALRGLGGRVEPFLPHRLRDGYDLGPAGVEAARRAGARLLLTTDCGVTAHTAIEAAQRSGIDVVVLDHHQPGPTLPSAVAVVDPHRPDCAYPNKALCGTAVAWKLVHALARRRGLEESFSLRYLDLVALASIADLMPLVGETRALVRLGLKVLARTANPGLRALQRRLGFGDRAPTSFHVGFLLAPRLNAPGRLGDPTDALALLLEDDGDRAWQRAEALDRANHARQSLEAAAHRDAFAAATAHFDPERTRALVLADRAWHPGVVGLVAGRMAQAFYRPTVIVALDDEGFGRGSARSIPGFDLVAALRACAEHLLRFGGHRSAAGLLLRAETVDAFRQAFETYAAAALDGDALRPRLAVDLALPPEAVDAALAERVAELGPFGVGNPEPVFLVPGVRLAGPPRRVGTAGDHLQLWIERAGDPLAAVGFRLGSRWAEARAAGRLDLVGHLELDAWGGRVRPRLRLLDLRPCAS